MFLSAAYAFIYSRKGQSLNIKEAAKNCSDLSYIECSYSQIARIFCHTSAGSYAIEAYQTGEKNLSMIAEKIGVTALGFRFYLRKWHRDLILKRGVLYEGDNNKEILSQSKHCLKSTTKNFVSIIADMKASFRLAVEVAAKYGFHLDVFREYPKRLEP